MDGEHLGNNRIKLGFGKSMPTNCVWIDSISDNVSENYLTSQFSRFGAVSQVAIDRERRLALVFFEQIQYAQTAVKEMRGVTLRGRKLQVDFASRECQEAFFDKLDKQQAGANSLLPAVPALAFEAAVNVAGSGNIAAGGGGSSGGSSSGRYSSSGSSRYAAQMDSLGRGRASSYSRSTSALPPAVDATVPTTAVKLSNSSRSRVVRYSSEYYDSGTDHVVEKRSRNYDEFSQGSAASSHEDLYDQDTYTPSSDRYRSGTNDLRVESPPPAALQARLADVEPPMRRRSEKSPGE
jgi:RNA recognition motif-containing protein